MNFFLYFSKIYFSGRGNKANGKVLSINIKETEKERETENRREKKKRRRIFVRMVGPIDVTWHYSGREDETCIVAYLNLWLGNKPIYCPVLIGAALHFRGQIAFSSFIL